MTLKEMLEKENQQKVKRRHDDEEHRIQCNCVRWFHLQYPTMKDILFAIPNGGSRNKGEAARMKGEGITTGVSDLIFLKSNRFYGALCIEMKKPAGRQSDTQKRWQQKTELNGNKYVICRSLEDFMREIKDYLSNM